jgi:hypothetical protein
MLLCVRVVDILNLNGFHYFFFPFLFSLALLPTHFRCSGLLLGLMACSGARTHTHIHTNTHGDNQSVSSGRGIGRSWRPVSDKVQHSHETDTHVRGGNDFLDSELFVPSFDSGGYRNC